MSTVTIGCRLPTGLVLQVGEKFVELEGQRQTQKRSPVIILTTDDFGVNEVDAAFWEAWKAQVGAEFAPLKSGAIFEAKNEKEAAAKSKDLKDKRTGHEPIAQSAKDIEAVK